MGASAADLEFLINNDLDEDGITPEELEQFLSGFNTKAEELGPGYEGSTLFRVIGNRKDLKNLLRKYIKASDSDFDPDMDYGEEPDDSDRFDDQIFDYDDEVDEDDNLDGDEVDDNLDDDEVDDNLDGDEVDDNLDDDPHEVDLSNLVNVLKDHKY